MLSKKQKSLTHRLNSTIESTISELKQQNIAPSSHLVLEKILALPLYSRLPHNLLNNSISHIFATLNISTHPNPITPLSPTSNPTPTPNQIQAPNPITQTPASQQNFKKRPRSLANEEESIISDVLQKKMKREAFLASQAKLDDLGGLTHILPLLTQLIYLPLQHNHLFQELGLLPPKGVLLIGAPGSGKTALAMAVGIHVRESYGHAFFFYNATELIAGVSGESEQNIRNLFEEAATSAPSLLFIDELDSIAGRKASASKDMERRVVSQLLSSLDSLPSSVFLLAATSRPEALDPGLRRSGRFDREICLGVPDENGRREMLDAMSRRVKKKEGFSFDKVAKLSPGYVPADLQSLIREAGMIAVDRISKQKEIDTDVKEVLMEEDVELALNFVQPTAKREGFSVVPDVTWDDIGALKDLKQELENSLILPIRKAELFKKFNISLPAGVLLYGPPGCGKTLLAKAVANASKANFIAIKGPELLNKYVGESEKAVRSVFSRARNSAPCIIFFDEIDSLCPRRSNDSSNPSSERVVNQFLTELDGVENRKDVFIIAATNRPDIIDPAMLRPGRLDKTLYVPLPNESDRFSILKALTRKTPLGIGIDLQKIASDKKVDGFSGADLGALVKEAAVGAILRQCEAVEEEDFERAMGKVVKSLGEKDKREFEKFRGSLKSLS